MTNSSRVTSYVQFNHLYYLAPDSAGLKTLNRMIDHFLGDLLDTSSWYIQECDTEPDENRFVGSVELLKDDVLKAIIAIRPR